MVELRQRKHGLQLTLPNGRTVSCAGRLRTLYARIGGRLQSVGAICEVCGEITLDGNPGEVWTRRGVKVDLTGEALEEFAGWDEGD